MGSKNIPKARYTLFANNREIGAKRRKNDVRRIVYKRRSPCFAKRFFSVCRTQDLRRSSSLLDEHKELFRRKKNCLSQLKLTANNKQCRATRSSRFRQQYFIQRKNNFVPLFVMFAHVCKLCMAGLRNSWPSKLEMSEVEKRGKIFLLSEVKMKFSVEQNVFIVCVYYVTKSYKRVQEEF